MSACQGLEGKRLKSFMLTIRNLNKEFDTPEGVLRAVRGVSFEVSRARFFSLLGPSGCGKTTTLRCIAGLERPDAGDIELENIAVFSSTSKHFVPPHQRDIGMVFQSYAIWPHMSVFDNVAFPLRTGRRLQRGELAEKVDRALALVRLEGLQDRPATNLSGGQQQRLALARAVVREPKLLLLDEPLSNLDAKLREEMRGELKRIQEILGLTTVYVTHDQTEALSMSDMVAVMNEGEIIQLDNPRSLYERPATQFVAEFIGAANLIPGTVKAPGSVDEPFLVDTPYGSLSFAPRDGYGAGVHVFVSVRPEDVQLSGDPKDGGWKGNVEHVSFLGGLVDYRVSVGELSLRARAHSSVYFNRGDEVFVHFQNHRCSILEIKETPGGSGNLGIT